MSKCSVILCCDIEAIGDHHDDNRASLDAVPFPTLSEDFLSCVECRAFEYPKCDGCPTSAFPIWAVEPKDPMKSIKLSRWIDALGLHTFGDGALAAIKSFEKH